MGALKQGLELRSAQDSFRITIDPPRDGWSRVCIQHGSRRLEISVSYTPADSIEQLAEAADACLSGLSNRSVVFHEEPQQVVLTLTRMTSQRMWSLALSGILITAVAVRVNCYSRTEFPCSLRDLFGVRFALWSRAVMLTSTSATGRVPFPPGSCNNWVRN